RARRLDLEIDPDVVTLDDVSRRTVAPNARRPRRQADPRHRENDGEQETDRDRIQRVRAEDPRGEIDDEAERSDCAAALGHTGTGVFSSASATISAPPRPADRASGPRINRCASTAGATAFTSSGTRYSRPSASARAFATRKSAMPERGLAPRYSRGSARVVRRSATTYRARLSST